MYSNSVIALLHQLRLDADTSHYKIDFWFSLKCVQVSVSTV